MGSDLEVYEDQDQKPLYQLIERLINCTDSKQNTVLTNSQLVNILQTEFNINTHELHPLEVEIYMSVMKKFLKDWPKWDDFDRLISETKYEPSCLKKALLKEYVCLKKYLKEMIITTKSLTKKAVKDLKASETPKTVVKDSKQLENNDVVLEVCCSREQLHHLIFRKPHPKLNNTIFNIDQVQSRIIVNSNYYSLRNILNFGFVNISISLNEFSYSREMINKVKHKLVNKKLGSEIFPIRLDRSLQQKSTKENNAWKALLENLLTAILDECMHLDDAYKTFIKMVFYIIFKDIEMLPSTFSIPGVYRRYLNKYAYVRYFYEEVPVDEMETNESEYDLQLQEISSPMLTYNISKALLLQSPKINSSQLSNMTWVKITCTLCDVKFTGIAVEKNLIQHFVDNHSSEPDWTCTNCNKSFNLKQLSQQRWQHCC